MVLEIAARSSATGWAGTSDIASSKASRASSSFPPRELSMEAEEESLRGHGGYLYIYIYIYISIYIYIYIYISLSLYLSIYIYKYI